MGVIGGLLVVLNLNGTLPARAADRMWGGPGEGLECAVCQRPVTKSEMEFEIDFAHNGGTPGIDKFHVHVRCFAAWEFDRRSAQVGDATRA